MPRARQREPLTAESLRDELTIFMQDMCKHIDDQLVLRLGTSAALSNSFPSSAAVKNPRPESMRTASNSKLNLQNSNSRLTRLTMNQAMDEEDKTAKEHESSSNVGLHPFFKRSPCRVKQRRSGMASEYIKVPSAQKDPRQTSTEFPVGVKDQAQRLSMCEEVSQRGGAVATLEDGAAGHAPLLASGNGEPAVVTTLTEEEAVAASIMQHRENSRSSREMALAAGDGEPSRPFIDAEDGGKDRQASNSSWLRDLVHSTTFERAIGILVLTNVVVLGLETDCQWQSEKSGEDSGFSVLLGASEGLFCITFLTETLCRLFVDGCDFFVGQDWAWNIFDLAVVSLQVFEQVTQAVVFFFLRSQADANFLRAMSILRVSRITRLVRMVRLLEELRTIMASICSSMVSLVWTFLLLMMLLYSSALFFTQVVLQAGQTRHREKLNYWYGGLGRTFLTMFECIFGGVSWDEVVEPLVADISPIMGGLFCVYIAFCVLAMMNMATGVFVDNAMRKAQEDKDTNTANRISDLFFNDPVLGQADSISYDQFCSKIDTPEMQDYFKAINVDPTEAKGLWRLLDADDSGAVDAEEMVSGCLRLRGGAKALELSLLMHETLRMNRTTSVFQAKVERYLIALCEALHTSPAQPLRASENHSLAPVGEVPRERTV